MGETYSDGIEFYELWAVYTDVKYLLAAVDLLSLHTHSWELKLTK